MKNQTNHTYKSWLFICQNAKSHQLCFSLLFTNAGRDHDHDGDDDGEGDGVGDDFAHAHMMCT